MLNNIKTFLYKIFYKEKKVVEYNKPEISVIKQLKKRSSSKFNNLK